MSLPERPEPEPLYRGLVSVKGVVCHLDTALLLRNRRGEWELPGGKLRIGETLEQCLIREFGEELGLAVAIGPIVDAGPHHVYPDIVVLVYGCVAKRPFALRCSDEHTAVGRFRLEQLSGLPIAPLYRRSITSWIRDPRSIHPAGSRRTH